MIRAALILLVLVGAARAEGAAVEAARAAKARLQAVQGQLAQAREASDRIAALTATVQAYEDGLVALRDGMRGAAAREAALARALEGQSAELARLLGVLQSIERAPAPLLLLHPSGPAGTARSGMIVAEVTPALQARADAVKARLREARDLRAVQAEAASVLQDGLDGAQSARAALAEAVAARGDLPRRFVDDPVQRALMIASAETLDEFTGLLIEYGPQSADLPDAGSLRGTLPPPVAGRLLRRFNAADAAGHRRAGVLLATRPRSLVTMPATATLRFSGPLLDYGTVAIIEPAADLLIVLGGLGEVFAAPGEVLPKGAPLGLMGGTPPDSDGFVNAEAGADRPETLYIEIREAGRPVDPAGWFVLE